MKPINEEEAVCIVADKLPGQVKIAIGAANSRILEEAKTVLFETVPAGQLLEKSGFFFISGEDREDLLSWFLTHLGALKNDLIEMM